MWRLWTPPAIRYVTHSSLRGAVSLRYRNRVEKKSLFLICEHEPYPVWFSWRRKSYPVVIVMWTLKPNLRRLSADAVTALQANASYGHSIPIYKHFKTDFMALKRLFHADGGGHGGLRYCGIELFFKRHFDNLDFNVRYCGIIQPCGMRFSSFWLTVFGKRRSFRYCGTVHLTSPV